MSVDLRELRDCIIEECEKSTCVGCKFNGLRISICDMQIISDDELQKLEEIVRCCNEY